MKKLWLLLPVLMLALTSCGPKGYRMVHVFSKNKCYEISSYEYYKYSNHVKLNVKGYGEIMLSIDEIALIQDECPFCGR